MSSKPRALRFLGTSIHWKLQWSWLQPSFLTHTNPIRSCGHCALSASNYYVNHVLETLPPPSFPARRCGTAGETARHFVGEEERPLANLWKKPFLLVGRLVNSDVLKERGRLAFTSALSNKRFSNGNLAFPGGGSKISPCEVEGCAVKGANYGFPDNSPTRCKKHCLKGMVRLKTACEASGCNTKAKFARPPSRKGVRCAAHKLEGMVNLDYPTCRAPKCSKPALFGPEWARHPQLCPSHREEGMTRIFHLRSGQCQFQHGCKLAAVYGYASDGKRKFCVKHREPEMGNLNQTLCRVGGCEIQASYGWADQKGVQRCANHREEGMVCKAAANSPCAFEGCGRRPKFGFEGKTPRLCGEHKEVGMRDLTQRVCAVLGCERYAYYGVGGDRPSRCGEHKGEGMVNVVFKLCGVAGCEKVAQFRVKGEVASHCIQHGEALKRGKANRL